MLLMRNHMPAREGVKGQGEGGLSPDVLTVITLLVRLPNHPYYT